MTKYPASRPFLVHIAAAIAAGSEVLRERAGTELPRIPPLLQPGFPLLSLSLAKRAVVIPDDTRRASALTVEPAILARELLRVDSSLRSWTRDNNAEIQAGQSGSATVLRTGDWLVRFVLFTAVSQNSSRSAECSERNGFR